VRKRIFFAMALVWSDLIQCRDLPLLTGVEAASASASENSLMTDPVLSSQDHLPEGNFSHDGESVSYVDSKKGDTIDSEPELFSPDITNPEENNKMDTERLSTTDCSTGEIDCSTEMQGDETMHGATVSPDHYVRDTTTAEPALRPSLTLSDQVYNMVSGAIKEGGKYIQDPELGANMLKGAIIGAAMTTAGVPNGTAQMLVGWGMNTAGNYAYNKLNDYVYGDRKAGEKKEGEIVDNQGKKDGTYIDYAKNTVKQGFSSTMGAIKNLDIGKKAGRWLIDSSATAMRKAAGF
jgi:hypothetical protein